jgi:hypothetical protein
MNERSQPMGRADRLRSAILAGALCLGSCAVTVQTDGTGSADLTSYGTYAWSTEPPPAAAGGRVIDDDLMAQLVERTVNEHLASKGMRLVSAGKARLLVAQQLSIAIRQQISDPYYSAVTDELYEEGSLKLDFVHRETGETVWWGTGRCRLQTVSRDVGLNRQQYVSTGAEQRPWPIQELVDAILAKVR